MLTPYVEHGGRVVIDAPGGWYDEHGLVFQTGEGPAFEKLFGVEVADFQHSNNVPRVLDGHPLNGFILELNPTRASTLVRFRTGEPAVTEQRLGKGTAVALAWDASFAAFRPGNERVETWIRRYALGGLTSPYGCEGAVVYRLAAPDADHCFFINDDEPKQVTLDAKGYRYVSASDPVSGEALRLGGPISLEAYSGRWLRYARR